MELAPAAPELFGLVASEAFGIKRCETLVWGSLLKHSQSCLQRSEGEEKRCSLDVSDRRYQKLNQGNVCLGPFSVGLVGKP